MPPYCFIENGAVVGRPLAPKTRYHVQQRSGLEAMGWNEEEVDMIFTERAVNFIDEVSTEAGEDPFFLYLTPSAPHRPCVPPAIVRGSAKAGRRGDMVGLVAWMVGQVVESLRKNGQLEDTLMIVTSDHGARLTDYEGNDHRHWNNGNLRGEKGDIYEGGHRVPFVVYWPNGSTEGLECDHVICHTDLLATFAEIVGQPTPADGAEDSNSFYRLLQLPHDPDPVHEYVVHQAGDGMLVSCNIHCA